MNTNHTSQEISEEISISDTTISSIVKNTVLTIKGVHSMSVRFYDGVVDEITTKLGQKRQPGVSVKHKKEGLAIHIYINAVYGTDLIELGQTIQRTVLTRLEKEVKINDVKINVSIEGLINPE